MTLLTDAIHLSILLLSIYVARKVRKIHIDIRVSENGKEPHV